MYYITDMRLEKTDNISDLFEAKKNDRIFVFFTHAWCFMKNEEKLEETARLLEKYGYKVTGPEG